MSVIPIETARQNLRELVEQLHVGEAVTLINDNGIPLAVIVSLMPAPEQKQPLPDWLKRWDALSQKVSGAWKSDKSAVEILSEMRR